MVSHLSLRSDVLRASALRSDIRLMSSATVFQPAILFRYGVKSYATPEGRPSQTRMEILLSTVLAVFLCRASVCSKV